MARPRKIAPATSLFTEDELERFLGCRRLLTAIIQVATGAATPTEAAQGTEWSPHALSSWARSAVRSPESKRGLITSLEQRHLGKRYFTQKLALWFEDAIRSKKRFKSADWFAGEIAPILGKMVSADTASRIWAKLEKEGSTTIRYQQAILRGNQANPKRAELKEKFLISLLDTWFRAKMDPLNLSEKHPLFVREEGIYAERSPLRNGLICQHRGINRSTPKGRSLQAVVIPPLWASVVPCEKLFEGIGERAFWSVEAVIWGNSCRGILLGSFPANAESWLEKPCPLIGKDFVVVPEKWVEAPTSEDGKLSKTLRPSLKRFDGTPENLLSTLRKTTSQVPCRAMLCSPRCRMNMAQLLDKEFKLARSKTMELMNAESHPAFEKLASWICGAKRIIPKDEGEEVEGRRRRSLLYWARTPFTS